MVRIIQTLPCSICDIIIIVRYFSAFAKASLHLGLAPVIVGFPATPILGARARFCMSASHTRERLEWVGYNKFTTLLQHDNTIGTV